MDPNASRDILEHSTLSGPPTQEEIKDGTIKMASVEKVTHLPGVTLTQYNNISFVVLVDLHHDRTPHITYDGVLVSVETVQYLLVDCICG